MPDINAVDEQKQALAERYNFSLEDGLLMLWDNDLPSRGLGHVGQVGRDNALARGTASRRVEERSAGGGRADVCRMYNYVSDV